MKILDSSYEGVSNWKDFVAENPTITIEEAQAILEHHHYHRHRTVLLDDWCRSQVNVRVLIYESTKDNIEIICRQCRISKLVSSNDLFDWMAGFRLQC